ncbi:MAG: ferritin-like domain-containing protein [Pseudomonadota bacterium]
MLIHSPRAPQRRASHNAVADTATQQLSQPVEVLSETSSVISTEFQSALSGLIPWHYPKTKTPIHRLYELAKAGQWNASTDVPWSQDDPLGHFPSDEANNPLVGFPDYDRLPEAERCRLSWWQHRLEVAEILHGEQAAMVIASQLVACLPTVEAKLFASTQVNDEARHVEFFSHYLTTLGGDIPGPSSALLKLIHASVDEARWDMKFIACQILIESLAMARFQELRQHTRVPELRFAIDYILRDEARHVRFGVEFLREHLATLEEAALEERCGFVLDNVLQLANSLNLYNRIAVAKGWDLAALRLHLRRYRLQHPELNRQRLRQLALNMEAVGLLTTTGRARLEQMNLVAV